MSMFSNTNYRGSKTRKKSLATKVFLPVYIQTFQAPLGKKLVVPKEYFHVTHLKLFMLEVRLLRSTKMMFFKVTH